VSVDQRYRDGTYLESNPTWGVEDAPWKAAQVLRMLKKHALRPSSICDVGCGAGHVLNELATLTDARILDGYDISPDAARFWPDIQTERLHFYQQDFQLRPQRLYDVLLCLDVFEHVQDYIGFLQAIRGGATYKIFHIPLDINAQAVIRMTPILQNRRTFGHIHYFSTETALLTLKDAGYEVIDWFHTGSGIERATTRLERIARFPRWLVGRFSSNLAARLLGGYSVLALSR
jgi:2-polyprenyl-3-methyl-5-hydroxy-6-metoxy-1,4-benzoquinol methylase